MKNITNKETTDTTTPENKSFTEHLSDVGVEVLINVKGKLALTVTALSITLITVGHGKILDYFGINETPEPENTEVFKLLSENKPLLQGLLLEKINKTSGSSNQQSYTNSHDNIKPLLNGDQFALQDANWEELFSNNKTLKLRLEDGWWTKNIILPENVSDGSSLEIIRRASYETHIYYSGNTMNLPKRTLYKFYKVNSGWIVVDH
jgi:hypothetical protein